MTTVKKWFVLLQDFQVHSQIIYKCLKSSWFWTRLEYKVTDFVSSHYFEIYSFWKIIDADNL